MDCRLYQKSLIITLLMICSSVTFSQTNNQQWRDSLNSLNRQIELSPYNTDLHLRKAAVNLELQQWEYAVDEYTLILRYESKNLSALYYRAYAYMHLRRYDLAKNDYETVLANVPTNKEARLGLAYMFQSSGRRKEALEQLNIVVEQHPEDPEAYVARASYEAELKLYEIALYDWEEAIKRKPANIDYALSYIDLLIISGKNNRAKTELDKLSGRGVATSLLHPFYNRLKKAKNK